MVSYYLNKIGFTFSIVGLVKIYLFSIIEFLSHVKLDYYLKIIAVNDELNTHLRVGLLRPAGQMLVNFAFQMNTFHVNLLQYFKI